MEPKDPIEIKIEAVLASLDGIKRAKPKPFFYTRLVSRMETTGQGAWDQIVSLLTRPVIAFGMVAIILALNFCVVIVKFNRPAPVVTTSLEQKDVSGVQEYSLAVNDSYYSEVNQ